MRNPYLLKLVALIERVGDSERFQRVERETEKIIAEAKIKVDQIINESMAKSEQMVHAAQVARTAYVKGTMPWEPAKGDHVTLGEEGGFESLNLTDVTVTIERNGKRGSTVVITASNGTSISIKNSGTASIVEDASSNPPVKAKKRRSRA